MPTSADTSSAAPTRRRPTALPCNAGAGREWLTPDGLEDVCRFISPAKGDSMHFSGSYRCELMRKCYTDSEIK